MQLSGSNLAYFTKNTTFSGFNQKVQMDTAGEVKTNYVVLDTDNSGSQLYQTYVVDLTSGVLRFAGRSINFPGGSPPPSDSNCWFEKNGVCTGGTIFRFGICMHSCLCLNMGAHGFVWMKSSRLYGIFFIPFVVYSSTLLSHSHIKLFVVILRCGGHLYRSGAGCHLDSCRRRAWNKSLYPVQPLNRNSFMLM